MNKLLKLLEKDARLTPAQLAVMLDRPQEQVEREVRQLEKDGTIRAYQAIIDWDRTDREYVTAVIELKVTPKRDYGFEAIAEQVMRFEEVETVLLMSGGYDLSVVVSGKTFQEVAMFVAKRLSTLESVVSTATHFVLRRYKENGVPFLNEPQDERAEG